MVRLVQLDQVDKLAAELNEIAGDWELFAGQLGVSRGKRKQIATNNAGKPNYAAQCLVDVLYCWVESSDKPSYEDIVDVLTKPGSFVTSRPLAKNIIQNYGLKNTLMQDQEITSVHKEREESKCHKISCFFIVSVLFTVLFIIGMNWCLGSGNCMWKSGAVTMKSSFFNRTAQHNLPYMPGDFVGRDEVLQDITQLLLDHRNSHVNTIAIYGPPLVGKSALAIEVGYRLVEQGVDVEYVDNVQKMNTDRDESEQYEQSMKAESEIDHNTKHRFSFSMYSPEKKRHISHCTRYISKLVRDLKNETLLIFDNCDSVLYDQTDFEEFKDFLIKLGGSALKLRILTTSRLQLILHEGFKEFPLNSLDTLSATKLLRSESRIEISDQESEAISELVGNVPHALIIVAHLISKDSLASEIIVKLKVSPIEVLSEDGNDFVSVYNSSYVHLDKDAKVCGHALSFFNSSFDSEI